MAEIPSNASQIRKQMESFALYVSKGGDGLDTPIERMPWPYTLVRGHGEDKHDSAYTHGGVLHKRSYRPKACSPCLCRSLSTGSFYALNTVNFSINLSISTYLSPLILNLALVRESEQKSRVLGKGKGGAVSSFFHLQFYAPPESPCCVNCSHNLNTSHNYDFGSS